MKRAIWLSSVFSLSLFALMLALGAAHADPQASEPRTVPAFHAVELAGTMEVEVAVGKGQSVQVSGEADLLAKVSTVVKSGVLVIDTPRDLRRRHHLHVAVTVPELSAVSLSGTGGMKITGVSSERFAMDVSGTGQLIVKGSTGSLRIDVGGTGEVVAKELTAKSAVVDVSGTGSATLFVTDSLEADVTGTGSIDVHGKPAKVRKSVSGVGSIRIR
jgi:hypothetical protein